MQKRRVNFSDSVSKSLYLILIVGFISILSFRFVFDLDELARSTKALTWPLVALLFLIIFKREITERISAIRIVRAGGVTTTLDPLKQKAETDIASKELAQVTEHQTGDKFSKSEVEEIMSISSAWGFNMAKIGFQNTPIPQISWDGRKPIINFGVSAPNSVSLAEKDLVVEKIQETLEAKDGLGVLDKSLGLNGFHPTKEEVLNKKLTRLYQQLRELDPDSVFLPRDKS